MKHVICDIGTFGRKSKGKIWGQQHVNGPTEFRPGADDLRNLLMELAGLYPGKVKYHLQLPTKSGEGNDISEDMIPVETKSIFNRIFRRGKQIPEYFGNITDEDVFIFIRVSSEEHPEDEELQNDRPRVLNIFLDPYRGPFDSLMSDYAVQKCLGMPDTDWNPRALEARTRCIAIHQKLHKYIMSKVVEEVRRSVTQKLPEPTLDLRTDQLRRDLETDLNKCGAELISIIKEPGHDCHGSTARGGDGQVVLPCNASWLQQR